jgi:DNA-binding beta-propeller fold protein YncE
MKAWRNTKNSLRVLLWTTMLVQPCSVFAAPSYVTQFGNGQLTNPTGLAVDTATGNIYVIDTGNTRVQVFGPSPNFNLINTFGSFGNANGQFNDPIDAAISPAGPNAGNVYVTDFVNVNTQVFASNGIFVGDLLGGGFYGPSGNCHRFYRKQLCS